ncbi:MAG: hypothetical protein BWX80_02230 [Candidatus Hydrogenedentes bacterium ADurb.Bin101]|nr:MAG: hypothetical protein BWX80_02230 [Candidatus Hydrogenedentes bacterium ADurb.Bin101]
MQPLDIGTVAIILIPKRRPFRGFLQDFQTLIQPAVRHVITAHTKPFLRQSALPSQVIRIAQDVKFTQYAAVFLRKIPLQKMALDVYIVIGLYLGKGRRNHGCQKKHGAQPETAGRKRHI